MLISKYAVRDYLAAPVKSWAFVKDAPREVLEYMVAKKTRRVGFEFKTRPHLHQLACFWIGIKVPRFMFLLDMGLGKTKIVLDVFQYLVLKGDAYRMLVVVPNEINVDGWVEEVEKHTDLNAVGLHGSTETRWDLVRESLAEVCVVHYSALLHMACNNKDNKMKVWNTRIRWFAKTFDVLVVDEAHKVKNTESVTHKVVYQISRRMHSAYGLTGTPFGREPIDLFGEFHVIDLGKALGTTLGLFRAAFYRQDLSGPWPKWEFKQRTKKKLFAKIGRSSIRYRDSECVDVPKVRRQVVETRWPLATFEWFKRLHEAAKNNEAESVWHTARGLASGYFRAKKDDGKESIIHFDENPKLDALSELAQSLPFGRKMIVFYEYVPTGELIAKRLRELNCSHVHVWGGAKSKAKLVASFRKDESVRVLVGNWRLIGTGGNLQAANYGVFFESPTSPIERSQCEKRFTGARQTEYKVAFIYDLVMRNSYDARILSFIEEGKDLFQAIIEGEEVLDA